MSGQLTERLAPPEDLRPAQLGIILVGRVIIGHISATLIDLSGRGFLRIEEVPGGESTHWLLTDLRHQAASPGVPLFPFELALLGGLFGRHAQLSLPGSADNPVPALDRVRTELERDAIRHGWLRRWRRDQRTAQGEQLLRQVQGFRRELRARALNGAGVPSGLAPYMMIFGLTALPGPGDDAAAAPSGEIPWGRLDDFSRAWANWVNDFCGSGGNGRSGDFTDQWSAPSSHDHANAGHQTGYDGYGGGSAISGGVNY
jgi:hypothetical protein